MTARNRWLLAIVGLLAGNLIAMIIIAFVAHHGASKVIPDYYNKPLGGARR